MPHLWWGRHSLLTCSHLIPMLLINLLRFLPFNPFQGTNLVVYWSNRYLDLYLSLKAKIVALVDHGPDINDLLSGIRQGVGIVSRSLYSLYKAEVIVFAAFFNALLRGINWLMFRSCSPIF